MTFDDLEVGYEIPARPGMALHEVETPCLIVDLDAFERNLRKLAAFVTAHDINLRVHGKMHKSADVARRQMEIGGARGVCCQKVSEAEAFLRSGITDILVTNQVRSPRMIDRLAALVAGGATIAVCVDDPANVAELAQAATAHGTVITCLVELECGAGRCGVATPDDAADLAKLIDATDGLTFGGIQAYQGAMQHLRAWADRKAAVDQVVAKVEKTLAAIKDAGLTCDVVTGAGTGSFEFEATSGVFTEIQCGSYAFMDADYGRIEDAEGAPLDQGQWENALFLLTRVISTVQPGQAVVDAGLKVQSVDSGLPLIFGETDIAYTACSDEHGIISDPQNRLRANDMLKLIPGHCDPTCNLHDWYVAMRGGRVEALWPISARGKAF